MRRATSINPAHVRSPTVYRVTPMPLPGRESHRPRRHGAYLRQVQGTGEHPDGDLHLTWFAGGGGSTEGAEQAGVQIDYALNHDAIALRLHEVNHPAAVTWCADAFTASPLELEPGRPIGSMWFSPDCTHHSKARGAAPKSARIRGLAWCVIPWAKIRRPRVIFIENVEEFQDWGPLDDDGQSIKARKGETFRLFNKRMAQAGYVGEWRELVTADYSDPELAPLGGQTTRKRLFAIFRCDGEPIVWPVRTHAPAHQAKALDFKPYCPAASFLDFAAPCPSIFLTQAEAKALGLKVKRPLVKATLRRIVKGLDRFVISSAQPFLVHLTHQGGDRVHSVGDPLATVTGANRGEIALVSPQVVTITHSKGGDRVQPADEPLRTVTTSQARRIRPLGSDAAAYRHAERQVLRRVWPGRADPHRDQRRRVGHGLGLPRPSVRLDGLGPVGRGAAGHGDVRRRWRQEQLDRRSRSIGHSASRCRRARTNRCARSPATRTTA
jgi:site-specific DNA-cytosine methylase